MNKIISRLTLTILVLVLNGVLVAQEIDSSIAQVDSTVTDSTNTDSTVVATSPIIYKIGDIADGNKSIPVHLIKLYDENGFSIHPDDEYLLPFSTKNTCGDCHTYDLIKNGTHFSIDVHDSTNRVGEPFLYSNHRSLTLLPLSYRGWEGTIYPDSVGISPFLFLKTFGSHVTGGNITENHDREDLENYFRWQVSGKLEINCLVCHDADPEYDQAEFAKQIRNENFRWASSASSSIANVKGNANKMPDNFDPYNTNTFVDVDLRTTPQPTINYKNEAFDENHKVFLNITKDVKKERCLFCHSTTLNSDSEKIISEQEDVHISAGLACVDCHKNDMKHDMIAGYSEEHMVKKNNELHSFSCEGCHLKSEDNHYSGRYGAPHPLHEGIPSVHFEKLSCTVCHSSYLPDEKAKMVKTSRAHKLGVPGPNKMPGTFPIIQSPVFVRAESGKIEPRKLIWPSYWANKIGNEIIPFEISFVENNIQPLLGLDSTFNFGTLPVIGDSTLVSVIDSLSTLHNFDGSVIFVSGGNGYEVINGEIKAYQLEEAKAYTWPIAHNVRPAQQSLGINGCDDCHSLDSDFYFADVSIISSINGGSENNVAMINYEGLNSVYETIFSFSFYFRPFLKWILILSTLSISLIVFSYLVSGIKSITEFLHNDTQSKDEKTI